LQAFSKLEQLTHITPSEKTGHVLSALPEPALAEFLNNRLQQFDMSKSRAGWTAGVRVVAAVARTAISFSLSPSNAGDAPEGRALFKKTVLSAKYVIMDRASEGDEIRQLVFDLGLTPVVPPKSNRIAPWGCGRQMYKKRNEIEHLFRRFKGFRRIFPRFDKLDVVFASFIHFAFITTALNSVNTP